MILQVTCQYIIKIINVSKKYVRKDMRQKEIFEKWPKSYKIHFWFLSLGKKNCYK